jgi:hypothetical protein
MSGPLSLGITKRLAVLIGHHDRIIHNAIPAFGDFGRDRCLLVPEFELRSF